ncbi:hypothetical protein PAXRUDRAFT_22622 [Paxillus rubicundulus Ve08.2h10]|uniref:Uncharacterized protein n=1 Tax=Paxillus rubicundulus Ve08.2h10 TaxID=930991 RepID=A0A0D0D533_9AGAM|nr:hypothetical protein PAXRUDRAFT_22622 [Paxillus rubicundulus Ve08.2h10]
MQGIFLHVVNIIWFSPHSPCNKVSYIAAYIVEGLFCIESFVEFIRCLLDNTEPFPPPIQSL